MPKVPVDGAIVLEVGPLLDRTDGFTYEDSIAYNETNMSVTLFKKTATSLTATAITLTSGGANDWTFKAKGTYEVEITAAQNDTEGVVWLEGICDGVWPFFSKKYEAVPTNIFNSLVLGSDFLDISLVQWLGTAPLALSSQRVQTAVLLSTTIDTLASQISFTLTAGSADDDAYNDCLIVVTDVSTATQKTVAIISNYIGSSKTIELAADPGIFTMATTDLIDIIPYKGPAKADIATSSELADAVHDEVIEGTLTSRQLMRIFLSALAGITTGGGTVTVNFRDDADGKNRIVATVDVNGNRTNIVLDGT